MEKFDQSSISIETKPDGSFVVHVTGDGVEGLLEAADEDGYAIIKDLWAKPRRRGIGKAMIEAAQAEVGNATPWCVFSVPEAVAFYKRLGFATIPGGVGADEGVWMVRR